jgi:hypothetical protein
MALDFPANPVNGQQFTAAGVTWVWDTVKWAASGLSVAYLPLAGGTMSGPIVLATDPAANLQAATKQYVDGVRYGDNRLVNGDMRIDQRNNGASGTANGYMVDRWQYNSTQASKGNWRRGGASVGFGGALVFTSTSAYTPVTADTFSFYQIIEADMLNDIGFGATGASPMTLSFWANSSLAGTFGGSIRNDATTRSYPFAFTLAANTWTKIVIAVPGDTTGTWTLSGNGAGMIVGFDLGSGATYRAAAGAWVAGNFVGATGSINVVATNGATFYLTGVKLEIGSTATPFNRQSLAKSLADCQRYYQQIMTSGRIAFAVAGQTAHHTVSWQSMRAAPTAALITAGTRSNASSIALNPGNINSGLYTWAGTASGDAYIFNDLWSLSAEL